MVIHQTLFTSGFKLRVSNIVLLSFLGFPFLFTNYNNDTVFYDSLLEFNNKEFYLCSTDRVSRTRSSILRTNSPSFQYIKSSDVVFLGNSRPLLGISNESIKKYSNKSKLSIFNLSFDLSDNKNFGLWILDKLDVQPKYLLVHVGPYIFSNKFTQQSYDAISNGSWSNFIDFFDFKITSFFQMNIYSYFGKPLNSSNPLFLYRSITNGCTKLVTNIKKYDFLYTSKNEKLSNETKISALQFLSWVEKRSIKPILFQVPA